MTISSLFAWIYTLISMFNQWQTHLWLQLWWNMTWSTIFPLLWRLWCFQTEILSEKKNYSIISTDRHQCCADSRFIFTTFFRNFPKPDDDDDEQRIIKIKVRSDGKLASGETRRYAMCQVWPRLVAQQQRPVAITRIFFCFDDFISNFYSKSGWNLTLFHFFFFASWLTFRTTHRATCEFDAFAASTGGSLIRPGRVKNSEIKHSRLFSFPFQPFDFNRTDRSRRKFFFFRPVRSHTIAAVNDHHFPWSHTALARSPQRVYGPAQKKRNQKKKTASSKIAHNNYITYNWTMDLNFESTLFFVVSLKISAPRLIHIQFRLCGDSQWSLRTLARKGLITPHIKPEKQFRNLFKSLNRTELQHVREFGTQASAHVRPTNKTQHHTRQIWIKKKLS